MEELYLYHGTELGCAKNILNKEFTIKRNDEHWLGNGVYFFEDEDLARWWTTNPTSKYGTTVKEPAILKCKILIDEQDILDLRRLQDYKHFCNIYKDIYLKKILRNGPDDAPKISQIRCAYCDFIQEYFQYKIIIGTFYKPTQPYLPLKYGKYFTKFELPYIEIQYCVFDNNVIVGKEII